MLRCGTVTGAITCKLWGMSPAETRIRTRDGFELYARTLQPPNGRRAAVAMVHGLGEHCGRYESLHRALTGAGFLVAAADLRGFGRSPGVRGHVDAWQDYRDDVAAIVSLAREAAPGAPLFLFGHSLGGLIALDVVAEDPTGFAGVIASAPALVPAARRRAMPAPLARLLSRFAPRLTVPSGLDAAGLSADPRVAIEYLADPLVHDRVSMRWRTEAKAAMGRVRSRPQAVRLPMLLQHGADDPLVTVAGTRGFFDGAAHPDRALRIYPDCRHEVHNDVGRREFERDLVNWIGERAAPPGLEPS
jgi:alpha-beta hydrolase superfamily lysophospholipase